MSYLATHKPFIFYWSMEIEAEKKLKSMKDELEGASQEKHADKIKTVKSLGPIIRNTLILPWVHRP